MIHSYRSPALDAYYIQIRSRAYSIPEPECGHLVTVAPKQTGPSSRLAREQTNPIAAAPALGHDEAGEPQGGLDAG